MSTTHEQISELTFEAGYERLQDIAARLNESDVPVSALAELLNEGKGLEKALTDYLNTVRTRIEQIDRGESVRTFRIVAGEQAPQSRVAATTAEFMRSSGPAQTGDDSDIPF